MQDPAEAEGRALRQLTFGVAPSSAKVYASHVKRFRRWCASVQGMTWPPGRSAVRSYELSLLADGVQPTSAKNAASVVGRFLALLDESLPEAVPPALAAVATTQPVPVRVIDPEALILASLGLDFGLTPPEVATPQPPLASQANATQLVEGLENMLKTLDSALLRYSGRCS